MIKIEAVEVTGFKQAILGMSNPMNSWDKSDALPTSERDPSIESLINEINELMTYVKEANSMTTFAYQTICSADDIAVYYDHEKIRDLFFRRRYKPFKPLLKPYNHRPVMQRAYNKKPP